MRLFIRIENHSTWSCLVCLANHKSCAGPVCEAGYRIEHSWSLELFLYQTFFGNSNNKILLVPDSTTIFFGDDGLLYCILLPIKATWRKAFDACNAVTGFRLAQTKTLIAFNMMSTVAQALGLGSTEC